MLQVLIAVRQGSIGGPINGSSLFNLLMFEQCPPDAGIGSPRVFAQGYFGLVLFWVRSYPMSSKKYALSKERLKIE